MKRKHKRIITTLLAWFMAFILLYVVTFGSWFTIPFAIGFVITQLSYYYISKLPNKIVSKYYFMNHYAPSCIAIMLAVILYVIFSKLSLAITILFWVFFLVGALLSYALCKVHINKKKK